MQLICLGIIGVGIAVALILTAFEKNLMYFYSPSEIRAGNAPTQRPFRIGGMVVKGSVVRQKSTLGVWFNLTDTANEQMVYFEGILPDLFREGQGIVAEGEELAQLKAELVDKLSGLIDTETGEVAINKVWDTDTVFSGPYKDDAPDLLVGYNAGYRIAWSGANGGVTDWVFEDNTKSWSGDHCVDPRLVPGVLFCNRKIASDKPALGDLPPTIMALFGADRSTYMKGQDLFAAPGPAIKSVR